LINDFKHTAAENDQSVVEHHQDTKMYYLDGYRSKRLYEEIFLNIDKAESTIDIFSPYVSDPLLSYVRNHKKENVALNIISPGINNKNIFKSILQNEMLKDYFTFFEYQGRMSHLKAVLIDDKQLICGSSNFDFISYYFEEEVVMITEDKGIVQDFIEKISSQDKVESIIKKSLGGTPNIIVPLLFAGIRRLCHVVATLINLRFVLNDARSHKHD
jgi:cardiolipin synthase